MRISDGSSDVCSSDLAILVGAKLSGFAQFSGEAERWLRHGMRHLLVTGCLLDDTPLGQLDTLLVSDGCRFRLRSPRLSGDRVWTRDLFAPLLVASLAYGSGLLSAPLPHDGRTTVVITQSMLTGNLAVPVAS